MSARRSNLALTCRFGFWLGGWPQVKWLAATALRVALSLGWAGLDDLQGELVQLGDQGPDGAGVVEQGLPGFELGVGEPAGHGLAVDLAGPFGVGAVPAGGVV